MSAGRCVECRELIAVVGVGRLLVLDVDLNDVEVHLNDMDVLCERCDR